MSELKSPDVPNTEEILGMILITNMRIYDALFLILKHLNGGYAAKMDEKHEFFQYIGTLPFVEKEPKNV